MMGKSNPDAIIANLKLKILWLEKEIKTMKEKLDENNIDYDERILTYSNRKGLYLREKQ